MLYKDSPLLLGLNGKSATCKFYVIQESVKCLSTVPPNINLIKTKMKRRIGSLRGYACGRGMVCFPTSGSANRYVGNMSNNDCVCPICYCLEPESNKRHQRSLELYLQKVEREDKQYSGGGNELHEKEGSYSVENYLNGFSKEKKVKAYSPSASARNATEAQESVDTDSSKVHLRTVKKIASFHSEKSKSQSAIEQRNEESSHLYLVSIVSSINIAVFLFEVASPVKNSDYNLWSLPLLYGAKVNDLILVGEWWRLVTPMFLHSGFFHVALSCWVLWDFGPRVCKGYGSFTFFLLYIIGGISGTSTSFLHMPEPTVGGSGPSFAIIGAWLIYQMQNKDAIPGEVSEKTFQRAIIATTLSFSLANFELIDSWTFLGAALAGIIYGFLTCPTTQLDDVFSKATRDEGITIARRYASPCKSLGIFTLFVLILSSLIFFLEPSFDAPELEGPLLITE